MEHDKINEELKFIVTGDSISKGVIYDESKSKYLILQENYVAILQSKLKGIVRNTAKFGNTVLKGTPKLESDLLKENYDVALIEYGGNDCDFNWNEIAENPDNEHKPKTDYNVFKDMLNGIVENVKNNKIIPVLMTLPPLNADSYLKWISNNNVSTENNILKWLGSATKIYWWQERYNAAIVNVAKETNTLLIDIREAFLEYPDFRNFLCIDGIHPNQFGHQIIAKKVLDFIGANYYYLLKEGKEQTV